MKKTDKALVIEGVQSTIDSLNEQIEDFKKANCNMVNAIEMTNNYMSPVVQGINHSNPIYGITKEFTLFHNGYVKGLLSAIEELEHLKISYEEYIK